MSEGKNILHCPTCGFAFDVSYGRAFACGGCPSLVQCGMAKCPKGGHEFHCQVSMEMPMEKTNRNSRLTQRVLRISSVNR